MKLSTLIFLFLILLGLHSCQCDYQKELMLSVNFESSIGDKPVFSEISAEGAKRKIPIQNLTLDGDEYSQFSLPLNHNADSSRYFFKSGERIDTLVIFYDREFEFQSNNCGFTVDFTVKEKIKSTMPYATKVRLFSSKGIYGGREGSITFY